MGSTQRDVVTEDDQRPGIEIPRTSVENPQTNHDGPGGGGLFRVSVRKSRARVSVDDGVPRLTC